MHMNFRRLAITVAIFTACRMIWAATHPSYPSTLGYPPLSLPALSIPESNEAADSTGWIQNEGEGFSVQAPGQMEPTESAVETPLGNLDTHIQTLLKDQT